MVQQQQCSEYTTQKWGKQQGISDLNRLEAEPYVQYSLYRKSSIIYCLKYSIL